MRTLNIVRLALLTVAVATLFAVNGPNHLSIPLASESARAESQGIQRDFTVTARKYEFAPNRIEVDQDDLVKVTLNTDDIAHSFTVDAYRIARRVGPGQSTTFEFRADKPGVFPFYCNLVADDGCRKMRGELVVRGR